MNSILLKYLSWLLLICVGFVYLYETFTSSKHTQYEKSNQTEKIVEWAQQNLPQIGILQENSDGFVYLKVDDNYINQLYPLLHESHYRKPPYFRRKDSPGAHISVFYVEESRHLNKNKIEEIGQHFSFKVIDLEQVPPHSHEFIVLKVDAPALEELRKKYGFKALLNNHDFHITIAKKRQHQHTAIHQTIFQPQ